MSMIMSYLRNERGAEMVEWVVVVAVLAVVAATVFGPGGVLETAITAGITKFTNQIVVVTRSIPKVLVVKTENTFSVTNIFWATSNNAMVGVIAIIKNTNAVAQKPTHQLTSTPKNLNNK